MTIDNDDDLAGLLRAGALVAEARRKMIAAVEPGVSTAELDSIGRAVFRTHGARSAPRLTYDFPGSTCISVNDEAAHGVPSRSRLLREGDLVNLDISAELEGYFADTGASVGVGDVAPVAARLLDAAKAAQRDASAAARVGRSLRAVGRAVQARANREGFKVVKDLYGHGVGRALHEPPSVPSFDDGSRELLRDGMVLAIEPFLSVSAERVIEASDGWTLRTADRSLVAQFEHTVVVRHGDPIVVTA